MKQRLRYRQPDGQVTVADVDHGGGPFNDSHQKEILRQQSHEVINGIPQPGKRIKGVGGRGRYVKVRTYSGAWEASELIRSSAGWEDAK